MMVTLVTSTNIKITHSLRAQESHHQELRPRVGKRNEDRRSPGTSQASCSNNCVTSLKGSVSRSRSPRRPLRSHLRHDQSQMTRINVSVATLPPRYTLVANHHHPSKWLATARTNARESTLFLQASRILIFRFLLCRSCGPVGAGCNCAKGTCACDTCVNKAHSSNVCCHCPLILLEALKDV